MELYDELESKKDETQVVGSLWKELQMIGAQRSFIATNHKA
jgi:hypothetical protein